MRERVHVDLSAHLRAGVRHPVTVFSYSTDPYVRTYSTHKSTCTQPASSDERK